MNAKQREAALTLQVLETIEGQSDVTQRLLAGRMGVALGLANSYLKRCVKKGLVKMQQAPANRYFYYLTPRGFAEKSRLTADYLSYSLSFYRTASTSCELCLGVCRDAGLTRLGLYGVSELAEIAALQAMKLGLPLHCVWDPTARLERFLDMAVVRGVQEPTGVEAWVLTTLRNPALSYVELVERVGESKVFAPAVLGLEPHRFEIDDAGQPARDDACRPANKNERRPAQ